MKATKNREMNKRAVTSIGLFITLIIMPISALITHITHDGPTSHIWLHIHVVAGILFTIFGILHVVYNWKALKRYIFGKN